jgi:anti-sigma-K factor RskA
VRIRTANKNRRSREFWRQFSQVERMAADEHGVLGCQFSVRVRAIPLVVAVVARGGRAWAAIR